jgi:hypothetical protein
MQQPTFDESGKGKQGLVMRQEDSDRQWAAKGAAAGKKRVDGCTTMGGTNKSRWQQQSRQGSTE